MLCECHYWMRLIISLRYKSTHLPTVASCDVDITYAIYVAQIYPPGRPCLCTCSRTLLKIGAMAPIYGVVCDMRVCLWWLPRILSDRQVLYKIQSTVFTRWWHLPRILTKALYLTRKDEVWNFVCDLKVLYILGFNNGMLCLAENIALQSKHRGRRPRCFHPRTWRFIVIQPLLFTK